MSVIRAKPGVEFSVISPGGFRMLSVIQQCAERLALDLTITSACDGEHSGADDPHHRGEAYDIRTRDLTPEQKNGVLANIMVTLGWDHFYGFLEAPNSDNEHIHLQVAKGRTYP